MTEKKYLKIRFSGDFIDNLKGGGGETLWAYTTDEPDVVELQNSPIFVDGIDISDFVRIDGNSADYTVDLKDGNAPLFPTPANVVAFVKKGNRETTWAKINDDNLPKVIELFKGLSEQEREKFGLTNYRPLFAFTHPLEENMSAEDIVFYNKVLDLCNFDFDTTE